MLHLLIDHGRPPEEAAAIIIDATLSSQRTVTGTLQQLADQLKEEPISEPALLIVGNVVNFRDHLRWFDSRALFARHALVMHATDEPGDLADLLRAHGAAVISDTDADVDIYRRLLDHTIDVVAFTSASAVLNFAATYGADQASDLLNHTVVATLGAAAADAIHRAHISPAVQLQEGSLGEFADAIAAHFTARASDSRSTQSV
jgi:uroporphyrinogen III methyltransferase/synthase